MTKIIILHGWTYATYKWDKFMTLMSEDGIEAKLLGIPGLTEAIDRAWTLNDYVNWLKNILDQEPRPVILLGHSNGGRIALALTVKYPEKISHLILLDSAGIYHHEWPLRLKRVVFGQLARLGKKFTTSPTLRKILHRLAGTRDYDRASPLMRQTMINLIEVDLRPVLGQIKVPTLIIWGSKDKATPLADGRLMQRLIPQAPLEVIEDAGHSPQASHPEIVLKIIKENINLSP